MIKTLRQAVFLRFVLFYVLGILIQTYWDLTSFWVYSGIVSFLFIGLSFLPSLNTSYTWRWLFGVGLSLLCVSTAGVLTAHNWKKSAWRGSEGMQVYRVQILDDPVKKPKTWMCKVQLGNQKAVVYLPVDRVSSTLRPSDWIEIKAQMEKVEQIYLRKQGIAARTLVYHGNWTKIENSQQQGFSLRFSALASRRFLLDRLRQLIPDEKSFSVAAAILFGYVNEIDRDLRQTFASTGSSHILSVSGLHFSIIYGILYFLFSFLGNSRRGMMIRQLIIIPLMWGFAFLTGMGPSVIRAAIMLSLWGIGNGFLFRAFTVNTLGVAAFFMLLYNPLYLFDVGFQLSFSAVLSILLLNPHLTALHDSKNPLVKYVWELSCVSTSAQLGTAPLSIYYFHQFPLLYLVTNLIVIPLAGLLLCLIPFSLFLHFLFGNQTWLTLPVNSVLFGFISALETLENIPRGLIDRINLNFDQVVLMGVFILFLLLLWIKKRIIWLYLILLLVASQVIYYLCTINL
jgi:competence protein ComEC